MPNRTLPVDNEIAKLVDGLIRNENQVQALSEVAAGETSGVAIDLAQLAQVHKETEARLQVVIAGVERVRGY